MDNIKEPMDINELYSVLPWHKKLARNCKSWFNDNIINFKFPWKKVIIFTLFILVFGGLYLIVEFSQSNFPTREPYDKTSFIESELYIDDYGQTTEIENDDYQLVFNNKTTTFYLLDKRTGKTWYSNPSGASARFQNPLEIYYAGSLGKVNMISVIKEAVDYDDYLIKASNNTIEVLYLVGGKKEVDSSDFPTIISSVRMEELVLSKLEEGSTDYRRITQQAYVSGEVNGELVWKLKDGIQSSILKELYRIMYETCDYNETELKYDQEAHGILIEDTYPYFEISVKYTLNESGLDVVLVNDSIVEKEKYPLIYIDVLPYFGCGTTLDEGYIMIPDGSGGLIDFNNDRSFALPYNKRIYGTDYAKFMDTKPEDAAAIRLPVFGIKNNDEGFISIIKQGAEMTSILANNSSVDNPYNQAYYRYHVREGEVYEFVSINSAVSINQWTTDYNTEDLSLSYRFIDEEEATYNEMASLYQSYLIESGVITNSDITKKPTIDLTLLGGYTSDENFLGIPYETVRALTSSKEALEITQSLVDEGVDYLNVIYTGFSNDGIKPTYMGNIDFNRRTGLAKDFAELSNQLVNMNVNFYPEAYINTAYTDHNINKSRMVVEDVFGNTVYRYSYNPASLYQDTASKKIYTLRPYTYTDTLESIYKAFNRINSSNIAFTDLGNQVYGSYKKGDTVFRNEAVLEFINAMEQSNFNNMIFRNPNLYAITYAANITDVSLESSNYQIITDSVPFYSLVFSGYLDYSGLSLNTNDSHTYQYNVMKAIETGSNLSMTWSYKSTIDLVDTEYSNYYSTYYLNWYDTLISTYRELDNLGVYNSHLINHQILTDDGLVTKSTYENGMEIIFNYRNASYSFDNQDIPANNYVIVEEGQSD